MNTVYLAGYTGRKPEVLKAAAEWLDAVVCDVRYSPHSRAAHWEQGAMKSLLGERYQWIRSLGNRNYRGGPIEIENLHDGLHAVRAILARRNAILLCACERSSSCHRGVVGAVLRDQGIPVLEMPWNPAATLPLL